MLSMLWDIRVNFYDLASAWRFYQLIWGFPILPFLKENIEIDRNSIFSMKEGASS